MGKAYTSNSSRQLRRVVGRQKFLEPVAKVSFSSKQSAHHRDTRLGDSLWARTIARKSSVSVSEMLPGSEEDEV